MVTSEPEEGRPRNRADDSGGWSNTWMRQNSIPSLVVPVGCNPCFCTVATTADAMSFNRLALLSAAMPETVEVKCDNTDCELDMFEVHYTYDVPEDHEVADLVCPYCTEATGLEEIEL